MKRTAYLLWAGLVLAGCQRDLPRPEAPHPRTVSFSPAITAMLFEMGLDDHIVGVTTYCTVPEGLDIPVVGSQLTVRSRRRGDRFRPLGMAGDKKLARFMIDARIPRVWRSRVPVVVAGGLAVAGRWIVWLAGWRIDDRAKVTSGTERALRLSFERRAGTD